MAQIEIVTIGDELVEGRLIDTNAGELSERLTRDGFAVTRQVSVGDRCDDIIAVLRECAHLEGAGQASRSKALCPTKSPNTSHSPR